MQTFLGEFRRALAKKMRLYDQSLIEITQVMSKILTESEFNSFETAVETPAVMHASKDDLQEGVLRVLKNIIKPKVDWSKLRSCVQIRK